MSQYQYDDLRAGFVFDDHYLVEHNLIPQLFMLILVNREAMVGDRLITIKKREIYLHLIILQADWSLTLNSGAKMPAFGLG